VCDLRYERASRIGAEYRIPTVTDQAEEIVKAPDLDLVVIATPTFTHYELAREAIRAGKHVQLDAGNRRDTDPGARDVAPRSEEEVRRQAADATDHHDHAGDDWFCPQPGQA
jgi:hypothetical protein